MALNKCWAGSNGEDVCEGHPTSTSTRLSVKQLDAASGMMDRWNHIVVAVAVVVVVVFVVVIVVVDAASGVMTSRKLSHLLI